MALPPSSIHGFYQNKYILKFPNDSSVTGNKRFSNTTSWCWTGVRDKSCRKYQFLNFAVCGKQKFECEHRKSVHFWPTKKVLISGPQRRNIYSQIDLFVEQGNFHINRWKRQTWKAIKNIKAWLSERNFKCIPQITMATTFLSWILLFSLPAYAGVDGLKIFNCLLKECRGELAHCIANPSCVANVVCIEICNNRPDETECQMKCGDLFQNSVVEHFNQCVLSRKKCVPQSKGQGTLPVPDPSAIVKKFNITDFSGKWYISGGLNPLFDTYDCQVHEFYPTSTNLTGKFSWRISTPDGGFFTRHDIKIFVQDFSQPGLLYNHNNEYLHYQDNWYILSSNIENNLDDYIFIYYQGTNDAWKGYEGAIVYTRTPAFPSSIMPQLEKAAGRVGLDFKKFKRTDNTCGPKLPLLARLEKMVDECEQAIAKEVQDLENKAEKVGRTEKRFF